jgi:sec-independent protein translocase protein TatB
MLDLFDPGKLLIVAIVALLVIGPKDLPRVLRTVGQMVGKMRRMAAEFQGQFMDALKEAELDDVKKELSALADSAKIEASFDPTTLMRDELSNSIDARSQIGASRVDLTKPSTEETHPPAAIPPAESAPQIAPAQAHAPEAAEAPDALLARGHRG